MPEINCAFTVGGLLSALPDAELPVQIAHARSDSIRPNISTASRPSFSAKRFWISLIRDLLLSENAKRMPIQSQTKAS